MASAASQARFPEAKQNKGWTQSPEPSSCAGEKEADRTEKGREEVEAPLLKVFGAGREPEYNLKRA